MFQLNVKENSQLDINDLVENLFACIADISAQQQNKAIRLLIDKLGCQRGESIMTLTKDISHLQNRIAELTELNGELSNMLMSSSSH